MLKSTAFSMVAKNSSLSTTADALLSSSKISISLSNSMKFSFDESAHKLVLSLYQVHDFLA